MGIDLISFNVERGNPKKLEASMIWNLCNWLEGVAYILETDEESLPDVQKIRETMTCRYVSLPLKSWGSHLTDTFRSILLRGVGIHDPNQLVDLINKAQSIGIEVKVELSVSSEEQIASIRDIAEHIFLNFTDISLLHHFMATPFDNLYGISFRSEVEEGVGLLNFDLLDTLLEKLGRGNEQELESE